MGDPPSARQPPPLDPLWLRRARARRASVAASSARVPLALAGRLMEHLAPVRLDPKVVLDVGAGHGVLTRLLEQRYPGALVVPTDDCMPMLAQHDVRRSVLDRLRRRRRAACADATALPVAAASTHLLCSNLTLAQSPDLPRALAECRRVLRHGSLLMFSFLGPDSLCELKQAFARLDGSERIPAFPDMHDVGDAMVQAGFSDVVVDVERLSVEFDSVDHLLRELRDAGGGHAGHARPRGLLTPRRLQRLRDTYPPARSQAPCDVTLEVGYAHAWVVERAATTVSLPRREP